MALLFFKADNLVLNGRAVARAHALDVAAVQRRAVQVVQDDAVHFGVGVGDVAVHLVVHRRAGQKAEGLQFAVGVAGLALQLGKINAAAVYAGGRAGFEAAQRKALRDKALRQRGGGVGAVGTAVVVGVAHKNAPAQAGAGGNDQRLAAVVAAQLGHDAADLPVLNVGGNDLRLMNVQVGGQLQRVFHPHVVALAVGLHAQAVYGGTLAAVEHPALQKGCIRRDAHQPAEGIDLAHKMPLGGAADGRVAGHIADKIQRKGKHSGFCPQNRRRVGSLNARVSRADYNNVVGS